MFKRVFVPIAILFFVAVITFPQAASSEDAESQTGPVIVTFGGLVSVKSPGKAWVPARVNMLLDKNTTIKTAPDSYCDISLDGSLENMVSIGPQTEIVVGEYMKKISVSKGRVFALLKNIDPDSEFKVATPTAIAGVRGTEWESIVDVTAKFNVKDGGVNVKGVDESGNITGEEDVPAGYSVAADATGWLGELIKLTEEDVKRLQEWSNNVLDRSTKQRECDDLISRYQGGSANLFAEVLECDAGRSGDAFAASGGVDVPTRNDIPDNSIGDDVTPTTFSDPPPQVEAPEMNSSCPGPFCRE